MRRTPFTRVDNTSSETTVVLGLQQLTRFTTTTAVVWCQSWTEGLLGVLNWWWWWLILAHILYLKPEYLPGEGGVSGRIWMQQQNY